MIKRTANKTNYYICNYNVILERTHNTKDGAPAYNAQIFTTLNNIDACNGVTVYCYSFKGHFNTEKNEALYILWHHVKNVIHDKTTAQYIYINNDFTELF